MNPDVFSEIRKLRNEVAHGVPNLDYNDVANRLKRIGLTVHPSELPALIPTLLQVFSAYGGEYFVPQVVLQVITRLLDGRTAQFVCDPWGGIGSVILSIQDATHAKRALALTRNVTEGAVGKAIARNAEWKIGDPFHLLTQIAEEFDVVASVLPFGMRNDKALTLTTTKGESIALEDDLGNLLLVAASKKLKSDGIGLFVITPSFFFSRRSVYRQFNALGLGIEAALALPSGAFAPYTNIQSYLVVVRRYTIPRMFVAQLTNDVSTNNQIVTNLKEAKEGGSLELGRFVKAEEFVGLESIRISERFKEVQKRFGVPAVRLEDLANVVNLGRPGPNFSFAKKENAIFVPLIGISDVLNSDEELTLKAQNYAQVVIDPARSNARFVARFLNSEFGKEIRETAKAGFIPKLNKESLKGLPVLIPDLMTQQEMLEVEAKISEHQNTLLGLQNELGDYRRELWSNPKTVGAVDQRLRNLSSRLNVGLKQHAVDGLEQWFETLPFPLASILRAWQATPSQDFKSKYEHLLHFFEATAEFLSIILLSAFSSREILFVEHKEKLTEVFKTQNLSFSRATFGVWKTVVEYLAKQTRQLLIKDKDSRAMCVDIFADFTLSLPEMLGRKELVEVLSETNKKRNDWTGHGGAVSLKEAKLRNELLVGDLQKIREAIADGWVGVQLVNALHSQLRRGVYENEIAVLMGSNSEFLKDTRNMSACLDVESLYLMRIDSPVALQLLPLVRVGPSPESAKNACYFYSRVERDGLKYVSYHFVDRPELKEAVEDKTGVLKFLLDA